VSTLPLWNLRIEVKHKQTKAVKLLLLGGGYTLLNLAARLSPAEFVVTTTSEQKCRELVGRGYNCELLDVSSSESLEQLVAKYPAVETVVDSIPPLRSGDSLLGVKNLIAACQALSLRRIIYLSTSGVFGSSDGQIVTEETPSNPYSESANNRDRSEQLYREAFGASLTALRISGIYGPGRGLGIMLKNGRYRIVEGEDRWTNRIHVEDLVEILYHLIDLVKLPSLPPVLIASDDRPSLSSEVVAFYIDKFKLPRPPTISRQQALEQGRQRFLLNQRLSNSLVKETLNLSLRFPDYTIGAGEEFYSS